MLFYAYVLALAGAVSSNTAASANADSGVAVAQKKICKRDVATGSVMPKRVCRTKAEWDALTAQGQNDMDRTREMERSRSMVGGNR